ncbi:MAG: sigma-70 family RNA polymerase sigma factor [Bdellovibrionales bacterium]|nr:sigma-70 family RNA polymerase sigma factor [Bdellovibrionales bacterium]
MNQKIMTAFQKGESWAFGEIYQIFFSPIQRYVQLRVGDVAVAQELTQEIFLKIFRFSSKYTVGLTFTTWLWTIARNTVSDFIRKTSAERSSTIFCVFGPDEFPSKDSNAERLLEQRDLRKQLIRSARRLSPLQRKVLWLRLVTQLSYQEISSQLGLTIEAAKSLAHRARVQLSSAGLQAQ